ncbi:Apm1p [Diplonema papillatum]|nr:Apm1p [Diplonema papillatum]
MINSLFILSTGGCVIIEKHWKGKLPRYVADDFYTDFVVPCESPKDVLPVVSSGKYVFVHILHCDLIFLAVLQGEAPVMMVLEILQKIVDTLDKYLSNATEDSIRDHFVTTYELLEEVLDDGFPMSFEPSLLKDLVPPPSLSKLFERLKGDSNAPPVTALDTSPVPWRKQGLKYANNEIFFDIVESLHTVVTSEGKVLSAEVQGVLEVNCRLTGMPQCLVQLVNPEILGDVWFHPCVQVKKWESGRCLQFTPPDGEFTVMGYSVSSPEGVQAFQAPFYVQPQIGFSDGGGRVSIMTGLRNGGVGLKDDSVVSDVKIVVPMPSSIDGCTCEPTQGSAMFDYSTREIVWEVGKLSKNKSSPTITCNLHVRADAPKPTVIPPCIVEFKQSMASFTGLKFDSVTLVNEKYRPYKGVRSTAKAGHFIIRPATK